MNVGLLAVLLHLALDSTVDHWHVLQVVNVRALHLEYCAPYFKVVPNFYLVKLALLSFG